MFALFVSDVRRLGDKIHVDARHARVHTSMHAYVPGESSSLATEATIHYGRVLPPSAGKYSVNVTSCAKHRTTAFDASQSGWLCF